MKPATEERNRTLKMRGYVVVTTTIPQNIQEYARIKGISIQAIIIQGYEAHKGREPFRERMAELEEKVSRMASKIQDQASVIYQFEYEKRIAKSRNGVNND